MQKKKLPIGIQTFKDIVDKKENFIYIDKTKNAFELINKTKYSFLSRPRRFGKSLLVSTLAEIFSGSKELFEGLYIYDKWDWSKKYPVIRIDFTGGGYSNKDDLIFSIKETLSDNFKHYKLSFDDFDAQLTGAILRRLIFTLHEKFNQKVVVLIDEYDKPILDNISRERKEMALVARETLKEFYSALKQSDSYLKFVFITGVSKFSKLNLFSGLNNLEDVTLKEDFSTITGYTQIELEKHFADYLEGLDLAEIKKWYNGYNYFGEPIYNPFDILLFFSNKGEFSNYWWETGNPSFLIEKLKEESYFLPDLENIEATKEVLNSFDVEHIDLVALLWQTGYLTFAEKTNIMGYTTYKLKIPNLEIQNSLNSLFFNYLTNIQNGNISGKLRLTKALLKKDFTTVKQELISLFAAIPYQNYVNNTISIYQGYYASVLYAYLSSIGFLVKTEESTNLGRIDMTMIGNGLVFIVEFKVDMPTEDAFHQIETKKYYEKYKSDYNDITLIGIHFNSEKRNIENMEWRKL